MKIVVTGGTGFVGRRVVRLLADEGHRVVVIARGIGPNRAPAGENVTWVRGSVTDRSLLDSTLAGCDAVAHLAGIDFEEAGQSFGVVHIRGTHNVVRAAFANDVPKIALLSSLEAHAASASLYHASKWAAEEMIRNSGLEYTVLKSAVIYGRGDHMVDYLREHMAGERTVRPVAVLDAAWAMAAAVTGDWLERHTALLVGPDEVPVAEAIRRVAAVTGIKAYGTGRLRHTLRRYIPAPRARAAVDAGGSLESIGGLVDLPAELAPITGFSTASIAAGMAS